MNLKIYLEATGLGSKPGRV